MDAKVRFLILTVIIAAALWYVGGFVVNNWLGIIFVALGISIAGYGVGNLMASPAPTHND